MIHRGKKAIITGGTRGIGKAIASRLAAEGCALVLNYLDDDETARATLGELRAKKSEATLVKANLADPAEARRLCDEALKALGGIDYLVHCAALGTFKKVSDLRLNQWDLSFDINVKSFLVMCQKISPAMKNGGAIVALSSSGAARYVPNYGAIGISKAALECLVKYLAVEFIGSGIRVNSVSAGPVETRALAAFPHPERMKEEMSVRTPAGRLGRPEDLTGLVSFLLSPDAAWIIGQVVVADGGLSLV